MERHKRPDCVVRLMICVHHLVYMRSSLSFAKCRRTPKISTCATSLEASTGSLLLTLANFGEVKATHAHGLPYFSCPAVYRAKIQDNWGNVHILSLLSAKLYFIHLFCIPCFRIILGDGVLLESTRQLTFYS